MPEEAEEAGLVTRKSEKRFTDWAGSVRRKMEKLEKQ